MRLDITLAKALGLAAGLALGTTAALAQGTGGTGSGSGVRVTKEGGTTSRSGMRVTKEPAGQMDTTTAAPSSTAAADSAAAAARARQDSIAAAERARQDSIAAANRAREDSIAAANRARQDSIAEAARRDSLARLAAMKIPRSFFVNLGGGVTVPTGTFRDGYGTGWNALVSLGWQKPTQILGFRVDGQYDRLDGQRFGSSTTENPAAQIWTAAADLIARFPMGQSSYRPALYLLGGAQVNHFRGWNQMFVSSGTNTETDQNQTKWGWNAGAGLSFGWGATDLFLESKWVEARLSDAAFGRGPTAKLHWVPVTLGITIR